MKTTHQAIENTDRLINEEGAFHALVGLGYKMLLKRYESSQGEIDFIAKYQGRLYFITLNRPYVDVMKVASYYIKRYGIQDVQACFMRINFDHKNGGLQEGGERK